MQIELKGAYEEEDQREMAMRPSKTPNERQTEMQMELKGAYEEEDHSILNESAAS